MVANGGCTQCGTSVFPERIYPVGRARCIYYHRGEEMNTPFSNSSSRIVGSIIKSYIVREVIVKRSHSGPVTTVIPAEGTHIGPVLRWQSFVPHLIAPWREIDHVENIVVANGDIR